MAGLIGLGKTIARRSGRRGFGRGWSGDRCGGGRRHGDMAQRATGSRRGLRVLSAPHDAFAAASRTHAPRTADNRAPCPAPAQTAQRARHRYV